MSNKTWEEIDITRDELDSVAEALKKDEFRKMFFEYCEEIQDPENRRIYEEQITQLESERGVDVIFINPEPGFVVKTSVDGKIKGFINIATCNKIAKPTSEVKQSEESGKTGLNWSIPFSQAPPRHDIDKKGLQCLVYDVIFHPDAVYLGDKNQVFRKHLIDTACDAVEQEFKVRLDRANLKFPKLKFKGVPRPTILRKFKENHDEKDIEPSPIDAIYPPLPNSTRDTTQPKIYEVSSKSVTEDYATPNYVIKHCRGVDLSEMTYELDAKINIAIPKDLIVEIDLPMLNSTQDCSLDVTNKKLFLSSEKPAKYKLLIDLPYLVNEQEGSAKFDHSSRKLIVTLPVCTGKEIKLKDIYREDSGVESDIRDESNIGNNISSKMEDEFETKLIEVLNSQETNDQCNIDKDLQDTIESTFLDNSIQYNFPSHFDCNTLDDNLALTLHVKNVDPKSIECRKDSKFVHIKFSTIGSGYYPIHYGFFVKLPTDCETTIENIETEAWDNNVILTLGLKNYENLKKYLAGLHENDVKEYQLTEEFIVNTKKFSQFHTNEGEKFQIYVKKCNENEVEIEIQQDENEKNNEIHDSTINTDSARIVNSSEYNEDQKDGKKGFNVAGKKNQKKKNKKRRSLSESYCDNLKSKISGLSTTLQSSTPKKIPNHIEDVDDDNDDDNDDDGDYDYEEINNESKDSSINSSPSRKIRSSSESRSEDGMSNPSSMTNKYSKGILKHHSRYCRSFSESCSSIDDHMYSCSIDLQRADSCAEIPEEGSQNNLSESCKKTVRFSDVIRKQLFRLDSSILGQRKKNQKKKNQKMRALQRRNSEGDSIDFEDKPPKSGSLVKTKSNHTTSQHDSGLDLSTDGNCDESLNDTNRSHNRREKFDLISEMEFKNSLIFDLEM